MKLLKGKLYFVAPIKSTKSSDLWLPRNNLYHMSVCNFGLPRDEVARNYLSQLNCQPIMLISIDPHSQHSKIVETWFEYRFLIGKEEIRFRPQNFKLEYFESLWILME